ncbi:OadG family transporter subunit [Lentisphaerota bacterium WC36G]|nr:OadG family protein [Lentisphaerae bacterium WC36]
MQEGFLLMALGMGAVFAFLVLLIGLVKGIAVLVKPIAHLLEEPAVAVARPAAKAATQSEDKTLMAAAVAAVHMHRSRKK